jgi:hypothetical protein
MTDPIFSVMPKLPTNRKFGWFFAFVFSFVAVYSYWKQWGLAASLALIGAVLFSAAALLFPRILSPLNRLWYGLGMLLGNIVNPIVLSFIFYMLITPISIVTRFLGRDELKIKKRHVESYWIDRSPPGPPSDSFKNQY